MPVGQYRFTRNLTTGSNLDATSYQTFGTNWKFSSTVFLRSIIGRAAVNGSPGTIKAVVYHTATQTRVAETGSSWNLVMGQEFELTFTSPVLLQANTEYMIVYNVPYANNTPFHSTSVGQAQNTTFTAGGVTLTKVNGERYQVGGDTYPTGYQQAGSAEPIIEMSFDLPPPGTNFFPSTESINRVGTTQSWTVPATGKYKITAKGARGGSAYLLSSSTVNPGGIGATATGVFDLTVGDIIDFKIGKPGADNPNATRGGGGGGATVVYNRTKSQILLVAGAGGGAGQYTGEEAVRNASATISGKNGIRDNFGSGGSTASGGGGSTYAGGGGGWSNGGTSGGGYGAGGTALNVASPAGGVGYNDGSSTTNFDGGYPGGGGAYAGAGGGGGYSGGGGGGWSYSGSGGGGGTYINPSATDTSIAVDNYAQGFANVILFNSEPTQAIVTPTQGQVISNKSGATTVPVSWSYSDPDNNPQVMYSFELWRLSDNTKVFETGAVTSSATNGTFPMSAIAQDGMYELRVGVNDGTVWSQGSNITFESTSWTTLSEVNSSAQSGYINAQNFEVGTYEIRVRANDGNGWSEWSDAKTQVLGPASNVYVMDGGVVKVAVKYIMENGVLKPLGPTIT